PCTFFARCGQISPPRTQYSINQLTLAQFFRSRCESARHVGNGGQPENCPNRVVSSSQHNGARDAVALYRSKPAKGIEPFEQGSALRRNSAESASTSPSPPFGGRGRDPTRRVGSVRVGGAADRLVGPAHAR